MSPKSSLIALNSNGKAFEAEERLRFTLERNPGNVYAWATLGMVLFNQGKAREAIEAQLKAIDLDWDNFELWNDLARLQYRAGYLKQTRQTLRHMISVRPHYIEGWEVLISVLEEMGLEKEQGMPVLMKW